MKENYKDVIQSQDEMINILKCLVNKLEEQVKYQDLVIHDYNNLIYKQSILMKDQKKLIKKLL
jgi:hypothetical protein